MQWITGERAFCRGKSGKTGGSSRTRRSFQADDGEIESKKQGVSIVQPEVGNSRVHEGTQ